MERRQGATRGASEDLDQEALTEAGGGGADAAQNYVMAGSLPAVAGANAAAAGPTASERAYGGLGPEGMPIGSPEERAREQRLAHMRETPTARVGEMPSLAQYFLQHRSLPEYAVRAVCATSSDRNALLLAALAQMKHGGHARRHLEHFLGGSGADLHVDVARLFADDSNVKATTIDLIRLQHEGEGDTSGVVRVHQDSYSNLDWRDAIGTLIFDWQLVPGTRMAKVSLLKKYVWSPDQIRPTQCLHQAAHRLVESGQAKEYWQIGETHVSLDEAPRRRETPARMYRAY